MDKVIDNNIIGAHSIIEADVWVESHSFIGDRVYLYEAVHLEPHVTIYRECVIGAQTRIKAGAVIGSDGFGFAPRQGRWQRVPQLGRVIIGQRCSIGANSTIDRGALEDTIIEDDVIIDNLVHLAHNVKVGQGSAIVAQVGVSGSTEIGQHCVLAGQVGTAGHLKIADGVHIMARGGVTADVDKPGHYAGFPLMPQKEWQKMMVYERNLPKLHQELKQLKRALTTLQAELDILKGTDSDDDSN
jgi:UDP-3-O-[3-hydroxymyristoyl] glucosamine N-acyltransferase